MLEGSSVACTLVQFYRLVFVFYPQPVLSHRFKMRATRDEHDISAAPGQPRAEVAANSTRSHDGDPQCALANIPSRTASAQW
jgi:hypothetical protein